MATTTQSATGETTKQLINYRTDAGVAVIEMNDPPANTYTYEMNRQLDEAILKARMDNDVHVIVLTGVGDKFFSAGANIKMLASVDPTFKYYFCLHANETLLRLEHTPKLVIAAINGHCVGGVPIVFNIRMDSIMAVNIETRTVLLLTAFAIGRVVAFVVMRPFVLTLTLQKTLD